MSQIMKTFLGVFLIMFMVVTSSGVLSGFKLEVYALYDSGRNDCTGSISADGMSLSFPDYGVYDMHVRITCKNGTMDHVRISVPINRKVVGL